MTNQGSSQPAGWYYAAGDPPGTHRYWDGTQWQGAPQPVAAAPAAAATGLQAPRPAELGSRFVAYLIDAAIHTAAFIAWIVLIVIFTSMSDALGLVMFFVGLVGLAALGIYNLWYLMGTTGQSFGKKQQNIKLVADATGEPVGVGMAIARSFISGIISIIDLIWILVDEENKRVTDKIFDFNVVSA